MSKKIISFISAIIFFIYLIGYTITQEQSDKVFTIEDDTQNINKENIIQKIINKIIEDDDEDDDFVKKIPKTKSNRGKITDNVNMMSKMSNHMKIIYKDGIYKGKGRSRFGNVYVKVDIKKGKIVSSKITKVTTSFPQYVIDPLPSQVIERQSSKVDIVTGATYSSKAFKTAVSKALKQATF